MKHVNMNARALSALVFNIIYRFAYTALFILCLVLLAITPGDHIYQTLANNRIGNVFVVGSVLIVTVLLAIFIYLSRLYTNRSVLGSIPKPYIPIEPGEVPAKVHRIIERNRERSAIVAWDSRPRDLRAEQHARAPSLDASDTDTDAEPGDAAAAPLTAKLKTRRRTSKHPTTLFPVSAAAPPWGPIAHPGWSDPSSSALPSVPFAAIVTELPHLIEAKAVSLAPPDPNAGVGVDADPTAPPDARVVALLQRPPPTGLRAYLARLEALGLVGDDDESSAAVDVFLSRYEYARFSGHALTEDEFQRLMDAFAAVLEGMRALDVVAVEEALASVEGSVSTGATSMAASSGSSVNSSRASVLRASARGLSASTSQSSFRSVVVRHGAG